MQSTIYLIVNTRNNKKYIGQTVSSLRERLTRHCNDAEMNKTNYHFHNAIRKYGRENFTIEKIEEICGSQEDIDSAEIYWIHKYDTYKNGYNSTIGGLGYCLFNQEEIITLLQEGKTALDIVKLLGCCESNVRKIARKNGIIIQRAYKAGVCQYDKEDNYIQSFESQAEAARWLVENKIAKGKIATATSKINEAVKEKRPTAYGFKWVNQN